MACGFEKRLPSSHPAEKCVVCEKAGTVRKPTYLQADGARQHEECKR